MKKEIILEKNKINSSNKESYFLLKLKNKLKNKNNKKRKKINLSIAVDVSGSMSTYLNSHGFHFQSLTKNLGDKKIDLVKKSLKNLVNLLNDDDIVSLISFNEISTVVFEASELKDNKNSLIESIDSLYPSGMTDILNGWLSSVKEVSKNLSNDYINEVMIFSDGCITSGINDIETILNHTKSISDQGIITSTFGMGNDFNEILMQQMSEYGNGNSHFIKNDDDFLNKINIEFNDISNISAKNVKFQIKEKKGVKIKEDFSQFSKDDNGLYILPSFINDKNIDLFFSFSYNLNKIKNNHFFDISIFYDDIDGNHCKKEFKIKFDICEKNEWTKLEKNIEAEEKLILLNSSKYKDDAIKELNKGNFDKMKNILREASDKIKATGYSTPSVLNEIGNLNELIEKSDNTNISSLSKTLSYQTYDIKRSR